MNITQLIKMVKQDTKKFLKSKDGKNYVNLLKQQKNTTNEVVCNKPDKLLSLNVYEYDSNGKKILTQ